MDNGAKHVISWVASVHTMYIARGQQGTKAIGSQRFISGEDVGVVVDDDD